MEDEQFQKYLLERLECMDKKLADLKERVTRIEENWIWIKRIGWIIIVAIAGKLGIDLSGMQP